MTRIPVTAESLNRECRCSAIDLGDIRGRIDRVLGGTPLLESHPNLFAELPVFLSADHWATMRRAIQAIEAVIATPAYQREVLAAAPEIAQRPVAPLGVFYGYDFHISDEGPRLIEINTNAGGAFLNIAARDAQIACCEASADYLQQLPDGAALETRVVEMFRQEWRLARGAQPLRSVAIVDHDPAEQFLYPEFRLAQHLFEAHGITARIADVAALRIVGDRVFVGDQLIDLVYNRSTDFALETAPAAALRQAYVADLAVVTPHPRAHALYANKRNLVLLSDAAALTRIGIAPDAIDVLQRVVPATRAVTGDEDAWWRDRKEWFFKPESGFGSRGTYRGDKITRRVFAEVMSGDYIAQEFTPAGERLSMKVDVRCYVYAGEVQLMAARLYQGQTTNFRTAGGGFAPVYVTG